MACHRAIDRAILYSAIGLSRNAADVRATCYVHFCQRYVLHLASAAETANQSYIVRSRLVNLQPRDGMVAAVEGAGVWLAFSAYRRPLSRQGEVCVKGDVDVGLALSLRSPAWLHFSAHRRW